MQWWFPAWWDSHSPNPLPHNHLRDWATAEWSELSGYCILLVAEVLLNGFLCLIFAIEGEVLELLLGHIWQLVTYKMAYHLVVSKPVSDSMTTCTKNGLDKLPRTSSIWYLRTILKDNQQGCSGLSNWFSMRCLVPGMNHLSPVWWPTFMFRSLLVSWYKSLIWWRGIFLLTSCLYLCFRHNPSFIYYFSFQISILSNSFHRRTLSSL